MAVVPRASTFSFSAISEASRRSARFYSHNTGSITGTFEGIDSFYGLERRHIQVVNRHSYRVVYGAAAGERPPAGTFNFHLGYWWRRRESNPLCRPRRGRASRGAVGTSGPSMRRQSGAIDRRVRLLT